MNTELVVSKGRAAILSVSLSVMLIIPLLVMVTSMIEVDQSFAGTKETPTQEVSLGDKPLGPEPVMVLKSTAYNSLESQTDSTPFITATGERTRSGIVALSRDLLEVIPYGSTVEIVDIRARPGAPNGCGATMKTVRRIEPYPGLSPGQFRVSDTMHPRKVEQLDMWLEHLEDAERWGACEVVVRVVARAQEPFFLASGK